MRQIGASAARNTLGSLLDEVEHGEEIAITRHGRPVARLISWSGAANRTDALAAMERIRARAAQLGLRGVTWEALKADRDAERR